MNQPIDPNLPVRPRPRAGVLKIDAYAPGKSKAPEGVRLFKLSSNETPLGPSPAATAAFSAAGGHLELYPDGAALKLREAVGRRYGIDPARIVCGAGSDELLTLLTHAYIGPGDEGLYSQYGFLMYKIAILGAGGTPVVAPELSRVADVDSILAAVTPRTKIVYLANPNNPTGSYLSHEAVKRLHAGLPAHVLLVLDAAYAEFVAANDYSSGLELAAESENVVMTRTFSKIHGLAGLRIGWMTGPAHALDAVNRIRGPFNMSFPAIEAGAAAIADQAHVARTVEHNLRWLEWTSEALRKLGLKVDPSVGNFILIDFPETPGRTAAEADAFLTARGIILRAVGAYGLPQSLRMTIGTEEACRAVVAALTQFMGR